MRNRWMRVALIALFLILVTGMVMACTVSSPIVGRWQDTQNKSQYLEFFKDGRVILDDGNLMITGTYELIGDDYVKLRFEGIAGAFVALFGAETSRVEISGDTMRLTQGGRTTTFRRVR
jgi:hypothetical protein